MVSILIYIGRKATLKTFYTYRGKLEDRINKFISDVKTQGMDLKFEEQMLEFNKFAKKPPLLSEA